MFTQAIATGGSFVERSFSHDDVTASFDQEAKCMRAARPVRDYSIEHDEHQAAAERGEECRGAVDGAGEHGRKNEPQDGVECRLLREKSSVAATDDHQCRDEDHHTAKTDLSERQRAGLSAEPRSVSRCATAVDIYDLPRS